MRETPCRGPLVFQGMGSPYLLPDADLGGCHPTDRERCERTGEQEPVPCGPPTGAAAALACLLGAPGPRADRRARRLLGARPLPELARAELDELTGELGLEEASARRVRAGFELARHLQVHTQPPRAPMSSAQRVHDYLAPRLHGSEQETFVALLLDGKHRLRRCLCVSLGTLTTSLVHPREVFRPAIRAAAAALVVAHNHPSGDPEPSAEDIEVTRRLLRVGELVGIPLLDHVVLGAGRFVSLRELLPEMGRPRAG